MSDTSGQYRFEVVGKIGAGSLFTVYRARDLVLNQTVALKVLRRQYAASAAFAAGLKRAARRALKLQHEGIERVLSVGQEGEHVFLACELREEATLHDLLVAEGPLPQRQALELFLGLCRAIDYAHRRHCPHGDLRPHNVFLDASGKATVADFGLAAAFSEANMPQAETLLRSIHYLAPERTAGGPPSVAADLYSLGVLLYQMLTGSVPFDAASPLSVAQKHANQPPAPMRSLNPRVSQPVEELVRRCLEKSPRARPPSVDALLGQVSELLDSPELAQPDPTPSRRKRRGADGRSYAWRTAASMTTSLAVIALCVALPFGGYRLWQYTLPREVLVPEVTGLPRQEAERVLGEAGLLLRVAQEEYNSDVGKDRVVRTEPPPGMRVKEQRVISAVISRGAELVLVPDVRQMSLQRAKDVLTKAGLTPAEVRENYDAVIPLGYVRQQSPPAASRVAKGTHVALQVSKGRRPSPESTHSDGEADSDDSQPRGEKKQARISLEVPQGAVSQRVRIVVSDERGDQVVYEKSHAPGERISQTVEGYGRNVRVLIFLDDVLVGERRLE